MPLIVLKRETPRSTEDKEMERELWRYNNNAERQTETKEER